MPQAEPNDATLFLPERRGLEALREAAAGCRGCHLWRGATQTVFGEGLKRSRVMMVGEMPRSCARLTTTRARRSGACSPRILRSSRTPFGATS
jgi:hypothetical protein